MEPRIFLSINELFQYLRDNFRQALYWVVDATCFELHKHQLESIDSNHIYIYPASEQNKNVDYYTNAMQFLTDQNVQRDAILVNLGGGVTTDFGGFVAATYRRGISCINIPTTLMGMTDAALGGKTGINFQHLKNVIGTFSSPKHIYICTEFLNTLPEKELLSGFAEMLKHGLIDDSSLWGELTQVNPSELDASRWQELIVKSTRVKLSIVERDYTESGIRKALNFGHTIGHAVESYALTNDITLTHGEAVAIGMICEAYISSETSGLSKNELIQISTKLDDLYIHHPEFREEIDKISAYIKYDKKGLNNQVGFSLLKSIGNCVIDAPVDAELITEGLNYYVDQAWK